MSNETPGNGSANGNGNGDVFVRVTNREIYSLIVNVREDVMEIKRQLIGVTGVSQDHSNRLRSLELKFYGLLAGLIGGVLFVVKTL